MDHFYERVRLTPPQSLGDRYSSLRRVKGDRKCGWRGMQQSSSPGPDSSPNLYLAIYFVYCELLLELNNPSFIDSEKQRFHEMYGQMDVLGETYKTLFEDTCLDATNDLLDMLKSWLGLPDAFDKLQAFFDTDEAAHVLYGLRVC